MKRYEQIPHTADIAAKVYGESLSELFENAAFAMFSLMADLEGLSPAESVDIQAEGPDKEGLLISWLNEVLYISYIKQILFSEFSIKTLEEGKLQAVARGEKIGTDMSRVKAEIKAATHHDLKITKTDSRYEVTIVFDV